VYDYSLPRSEGGTNPHIWTNPIHAPTYARPIRDKLIERDPEAAE